MSHEFTGETAFIAIFSLSPSLDRRFKSKKKKIIVHISLSLLVLFVFVGVIVCLSTLVSLVILTVFVDSGVNVEDKIRPEWDCIRY